MLGKEIGYDIPTRQTQYDGTGKEPMLSTVLQTVDKILWNNNFRGFEMEYTC